MNIEELDIPNMEGLLSERENKARSLLMNRIIADGCPVKAADFIDPELVRNLAAKQAIVLDANGFVTVVYPVAAFSTPHKVKLKDNRFFYSICAVDSLGSAFTFEQDIVVSSSCSHCQKPVSVTIEHEEVTKFEPEGLCVTHTNLVGEANWAGSC